MESTDEKLTEKLTAFDKEQEPALMYEAVELIETAGRNIATGDEAAFMNTISLWLRFLAGLDRSIDPAFDPGAVPVKGATPPPTHGVVHPSGEVDPSTIPDPVARAEYEQALKASKDYEKWWSLQFQLRRIDERAIGDLKRLLTYAFADASVNRAEFEELLAASSLSDARKAQLRALMPHAGS